MTTAYDESVIEFDLNYLNQDSNGTPIANKADKNKYEKQKRNISIMKKKIIATDALITKYYTKKQMLFDAEKNLAGTKEECKQICLDYRQALEKCSVLETERQTVQTAYKTVEERCGQLENQCAAFQSHIHQLQQLIKEKDTALESLRTEKKKTYVKEVDKKAVYTRDRERTSLNKDIKLFTELVKKILGKKRLKGRYNELLRKYEISSDGNASDTSDVFEEPFSPPFSPVTKKPSNTATDSECDYSVDTGRGSSLGSDNDKFILSPDCFIEDNPRSSVTIENRSKIKVANVATSPIIFEDVVEEPSLPLILDDEELESSKNESSNIESQLNMVDRCLSPIRINKRSVCTSPMELETVVQIQIENEFESKDASTMTNQTLPLITIDRSVSPINISSGVSVFTSPMKHFTREIATSPEIINENIIENESTQENNQKECLELNNSNNMRRDNNADFEIEMILNSMQMSHGIITPIPKTPSRSRYTESRNVPSRLSSVSSHPRLFEGGFLETVDEYSRVEELKMELDNLKSVLKQHILLTSKPLQFNHKPLLNKLVTDDDDNLNEIEYMDTNENSLSDNTLDHSEMRQESNLEVSQYGLVLSPIDNDLLFGTSQSSTERDLHNMIKDNKAQISFPKIHSESILQNLEETEIPTEANTQSCAQEICEDGNDASNPENSEVDDEPVKVIKLKRTKRKRLSKLDKLKKVLKPKHKIRSKTPTIFKSQLKSKPHNLPDKKISKNETSASLNDKAVYEKAVKIMAELNSKQNSQTRKDPIKESLSSSEISPKIENIQIGDGAPPKSNIKEPIKDSSSVSDSCPKKTLTDNIQIDSQTLPKDSLSTSETSSKKTENSQTGNQIPPKTTQKDLKNYLSTSESSVKKTLTDNSQIGNGTPPATIQKDLIKDSLTTSEFSQKKTLMDISQIDNQTPLKITQKDPAKTSLFTSESSPKQTTMDNCQIGNGTLPKATQKDPIKESLSRSESSLKKTIMDNSQIGNGTPPKTAKKEPVKDSLSTNLSSPTTLMENSQTDNQTPQQDPIKESLFTSESSPNKTLTNNSQIGNLTAPKTTQKSSLIESLFGSESSPKKTLTNNSQIGNLTSQKTTKKSSLLEFLFTSEPSPKKTLTENSQTDNRTPLTSTQKYPIKESLFTSESSLKKTLTNNSEIGNRTPPKTTRKSSFIESLFTSEPSPKNTSTDNSQTDTRPTPKSTQKDLTKESLFTSESSPKKTLTADSQIGHRTPPNAIQKGILSTSETSSRKTLTNNNQIGNRASQRTSRKETIKELLSTNEISPKTDKIQIGHQKTNEAAPELKPISKTLVSSARAKIDLFSNDKQPEDNVRSTDILTSPTSQIATRSKSKPCFVVLTKSPVALPAQQTKTSEQVQDKQKVNVESEIQSPQVSRKRRNNSDFEPEIQCKRILRSSTAQKRSSTENKEVSNATNNNKSMDIRSPRKLDMNTTNEEDSMKPWKNINHDIAISYEDLDLFSDDVQSEDVKCQEKVPLNNANDFHPKQSILCSMIDKYGVAKVRNFAKKAPDAAAVKMVSDKMEQYINYIIESSPAESKIVMDKFVTDLKKVNHKHFLAGLMKYLTKPDRKMELFSKVVTAPAPPMTKAEQILIYVILNLKRNWPSIDIVDAILTNIEYTLFKLNRTPDFGVVESASHFYAILCRYFRAKSRLRLFILDAMYCTQFKSIRLIMQCLDVWSHIIPLAHMGIAKCPLVTCLVYLLHFYKCNDKLNNIQVIRKILSERYFYKITDWNETKIVEMFRHAIKELKDVPIDRKMLRLALIILAKRQGPKWCQNHIIKNLLLPMIEKPNVPENVKEFCVSMIGPLMKPYPADMKVNCEIVMNKLSDMLNQEQSQAMEEAIITSMVFINRHNQMSINKVLLSRKMKPFSAELEEILREYVRAIPLKVWERNISQIVHSSKYN